METTVTNIPLTIPELVADEWYEQYDRLFARHVDALPDAVISVTANRPNTERGYLLRRSDGKLDLDWHVLGTAPIDNEEKVWDKAERLARKGAACYIGVAPRLAGTKGQGGKKDVAAHVALVADLDWAEGDHQSDSNPPREVLEQWIADLPVLPGLVVNSGGGFHIYVTLDAPVDMQRTEEGKALYRGFAHWWSERAKRDGYNVDLAPLNNQALVLRIAGTPAPKYPGEMVHIERSVETTDEDHSLETMLSAFPAPPAEAPKRRGSKRASKSAADQADAPREPVPVAASLDEYTPGDVFAVEGDAMELLTRLFDVEYAGSSVDHSSLLVPWFGNGAPEYPPGKNAGVFLHYDGTALLSIYGQGVREEWAERFGSEPDQSRELDLYNAFYILAQYVAMVGATPEQAWGIAARLVRHYRNVKDGFVDYGTLVEDVATSYRVEDIEALLPAREQQSAPTRLAPPTRSWDISDYALPESAAEQLRDAFVAPLVAAARGYEVASDPKSFAKDTLELTPARTRTFVSKVDPGTLAVPWHAPDSDELCARWEVGSWDSAKGATLDLHPASPAWDDASVIIEYGVLAADRTLTRLLLAEGHSYEDLAQTEDAAGTLTKMLREIPRDRRVIVIALGLGAWVEAPWHTLTPKKRTFWISDAQIETDLGWQRIYRVWLRLRQDNADVMLAPTFADDLDAALDAAATRFPSRPRFIG